MPSVKDRGRLNEIDPARRHRICESIKAYLQTDDLSQDNKPASQSDLDAVARAMDELQHDRAAVEKMVFIKLVFADGLTIAEVARLVYISYSTAKRWKSQIIRLTDKYMPPLPRPPGEVAAEG